MTTVEIVDQTLRDGQQSLWGMRMRAAHALPVASNVDAAGYRIVDLTGSSIFEVLVRHFRENPWEGLDLLRAAMPHVTLRAGTRSNGVVGMGLTPEAIVELWVRTLARHGIGSLWIFDCLHNLEEMHRVADVARDAGMLPSPQIMFGLSPVHTDDHYAGILRAMAGWEGLDSVVLGDEAGVMSPIRAASWIPRMRAAAGSLPLEMHFHDTTGMADLNYITGVEAGVTILHTAVSTMASGPSLPATETAVDNLRRLGHDVMVDDRALPAVATHFQRVATTEGYRTGAPAEYRVATVQQQLPGGMTGTLANQLRSYNMEARLPEVLEEVITVRAEMGYPIMATPFSQLVGIQALLNVVNGERYSVIPDEILVYLAGHLGPHPAPVSPEVLDRAFSTPHGRYFLEWTPPQPTLKEVRHAYGETLSDEELLLRYLIPNADVDAMYAAGPVQRYLPLAEESSLGWIRNLLASATAVALRAECNGVEVKLSR